MERVTQREIDEYKRDNPGEDVAEWLNQRLGLRDRKAVRGFGDRHPHDRQREQARSIQRLANQEL